MRRLGRIVTALAPWVGLGVLAWRQQTLESGIAKFVESAARTLQAHTAASLDDVPIPGEEARTHGPEQRAVWD